MDRDHQLTGHIELARRRAGWEHLPVVTRASALGVCTWLVLASGCSRVAPGFTDDGGSDGSPVLDPYPYATQGSGSSSEESSSSDTDTDTDTGPDPIPDQPVDNACDLVLGLSCSGEDKCVPIPWQCCGLFECVPVLGNKGVGESCFNEGQGSNLDDCGADSYCLSGVCRAFCDLQGDCGPASQCRDDGPLWVCVEPCDPLGQDCPAGQGCYYEPPYGFQCNELGNKAELGQPCTDSLTSCLPGLVCVPESQYPDGCGGGQQGCCTNLCDLELGDAACADGPLGTGCTEIGVPSDPQLGACTGSNFAPGDLQIVEIFADPPGITIVEPPLEFVEIINLSNKQIDLGLLAFGDFINQGSEDILDAYEPALGDGGCAQVSAYCLAPGRRALFVGNGYVGQTNGALVLRSQTAQILGALLQPFTRLKIYDKAANPQLVVSSYRSWNDPDIGPWPVDEQPIHRIDPAGPDVTENWVSGPATPGL